jgi:hypothetical protein
MSATTPEQRVGKRAEQKRRWDREKNRGECAICGAVTWQRKTRCGRHDVQHDRAWLRKREIIRRYEAGEPLRDIAVAIGTTRDALSTDLDRIRKSGYPLPYRNKGYGKRVAA